MKIAIIGTRGFPNVQGGVEKHCENLAVNLVKIGHEVTVYTRRPYVDPKLRYYKGVRLKCLPALRQKHLENPLHSFLSLFAAFCSKPDVLHVQSVGTALIVPFARLLGFRVVLTTHGSNYRHMKWGRFSRLVLRLSERLGVRFSNRVIAVSPVIRDEVRELYGVEARYIPNGVTIDGAGEKSLEVLEKFGIEKGRYLLCVGRFVPEKGFHDVILSFNRLSANEKAFAIRLVIVGGADHPDRYSENLKSEGAKNERIVFPGVLTEEELGPLYDNARLFIMSSYYEGFPITLLEALGHGCPCLVSDIPAHRILPLPERHYYRPGDVTALAEKMRSAMMKNVSRENEKYLKKLVAGRYSWEHAAAETSRVYESL